MRGIFSIDEALAMAEEADLDLVNISPNADPPVCKILDYGKYRYEQQKKEKNAKKNQHVTEIKEIRLSASIEDHDITVKAKAASKFLQDGDKVKVSLRFRGRERDYTQLGFDAMKKFADLVSEYGVIEKATPEDTVGWYRMIHEAFERHGIARSAWSYRAMNFGLSDARLDGVREELIRLL